jgi:hypothetical protein
VINPSSAAARRQTVDPVGSARLREYIRNVIEASSCFRILGRAPGSQKVLHRLPRLPRWMKCQSFASPSVLEYWHIGQTNTRFANLISRIARGSNNESYGQYLPSPSRRSKSASMARSLLRWLQQTSFITRARTANDGRELVFAVQGQSYRPGFDEELTVAARKTKSS